MILFFLFLLAYLIGSIPFGLIISRMRGIDIRKHGSGNIGATNVFRVVGKKWGITVFILDALKGYMSVLLPVIFKQQAPLTLSLALALAVILGHTFPIWLKFKGGKGVATSLGAFLAAAPKPALITFGGWIIIFLATRIISAASLSAAVLFPIVICLIYPRETPGFTTLILVSLFLTAFIFYTHRQNIQRLLKGEEKRIF